MASKPRDLITRFVSDVVPFLRGTDQVSDAFDDMARDQDKLVREGTEASRDIGRAYERLSDKVKRENRETQRSTKEAYGDAGKEAGDEFAQNLGESISSGDISGLLSGTVGGLVGTFGKGGPIALALGALGAAGVGAFTIIQQAAENARQAAIDAFEEILSGAEREVRLRGALERQYGSYLEGLEKIQKMADATGIPVEEIADAFANGGEPARRLAEEAERIADASVRGSKFSPSLGPNQARVTLANNLAEDLERAATATERAAAAEKVRADALRESARYWQQAYGQGSSAYQSQLGAAAPYVTGRKQGTT